MAGHDDARGEAVEEFLAKSLLLRECDATVIAKVTPHMMLSEHPAGATLVRAGSPSDGISILRRGRATASLVHATTGASTPLETLNVGDHFGDVGALTRASHPVEQVQVVGHHAERAEGLAQRRERVLGVVDAAEEHRLAEQHRAGRPQAAHGQRHLGVELRGVVDV